MTTERDGLVQGPQAANRDRNHPYVFDVYIGSACLRCGLEMNHHLHCGPFGPGLTKEPAAADALSAAQRSHEALIAQIDEAHQELSDAVIRQWNAKLAFKLSIPARLDHDTDCIIGAALRDARAALLSERSPRPATHEQDAGLQR